MSKGDIVAFRIARETANYKADDVSGAGAARTGGRWNAGEVPIVYASCSRALAAMETLVHRREPPGPQLPLDLYLIEMTIPAPSWKRREVFNARAHPAWGAIPDSATAREWGTAWAREGRSLIAVVPSVIVPEEWNVLINAAHEDVKSLRVEVARKWLYDLRLWQIKLTKTQTT